ncbi:MAG: 16S rRNA (uracil(1498)-N(3))-methyltransferase [Desulfamplus sp.]|nr:16S rRNA (uracil(1498)-N(3))-methyltransferase [Desulfamplus sp.]
MNLILLFEDDFTAPDKVSISGRRVEHILKVHRAKIGDILTVGLLNSKIGTGKILAIDIQQIEMEVTLDYDPPKPIPLTLVVALPRPKMLKRILQSVASLGIKKIYLINSWRVEKAFWSSPLLEPERLKDELILGLEQAKDTILPQIHLKRLFKPFVTEELSILTKGSSNNKPIALAAHPKAALPCPQNINQSAILAMGPEGGFIDIEIETLEQAGFSTVNLGRRILRLETAVPFIVSKLF